MRIHLPHEIKTQLCRSLLRAGEKEIGGVLMGENIGPSEFRIHDLTIQGSGGSFATFLRDVVQALDPLRRFFSRTRNDYTRYNYLGEWHSHPSFAPVPSMQDERSMREIVEDPEVGATFAVLLIVRIDGESSLDATATVFLPGQQNFRAELLMDERS